MIDAAPITDDLDIPAFPMGARMAARNSHRTMTVRSPADVLRARAEARALLFAAGELDLHLAVDELQRAAAETGLLATIGQDAVKAIMAEAFGAVT